MREPSTAATPIVGDAFSRSAHDCGLEHDSHALQDALRRLALRVPDRLQDVDHLGRGDFVYGALADGWKHVGLHSGGPLSLVLVAGELLLFHLEVVIEGSPEGD